MEIFRFHPLDNNKYIKSYETILSSYFNQNAI